MIENTFARDVDEGLSGHPKFLSSKYFYDENGGKIFQKIMNLPEYYLTDCEAEIFEENKNKIRRIFNDSTDESFNLLELGAGDGMKTKILLRHFLLRETQFTYIPIDIDEAANETLAKGLKKEFFNLDLKTISEDYFSALEKVRFDGRRNIMMFLGSNIGNFTNEEAGRFFRHLRELIKPNDLFLIGFDLKKDPRVILDAYDDKSGVTKEFNLNLLRRINRELGADFDIDKFDHFESYNPISGETKSYIISREEQKVRIKSLDRSYEFGEWEPIYTEVSMKYDTGDIDRIAYESGFEVVENLFDSKKYFASSIWRAV